MYKLAKKITLFIILLGFFIFPTHILATTEDNFNPHNLISDEEMQNWQSMERADIQAFLVDKNSFLANYKAKDKEGVTRTASDIIARAAREHQINPKYLLVKLQKEQSLITAKNPTEKQLNGATGYGISDGCGWTCTTYLNNIGFGKQIDAAAGIIRWYYENMSKEIWIKRPNISYIIDNQLIIPKNKATAFLYTYTPHIQGNKNFWKIWNDWFSQVYPDGSLLKAQTSANIYLIQDGKKRNIKNMSVLLSRFDIKMVIEVNDSELANYPDGIELNFPNYSILRQNSQYYLVDFDTIRPFENANTVKTLGYHPDEILDVNESDLAGYIIGQKITVDTTNFVGKLLRVKENNNLYYLKDNTLFPITDPDIAKVNFPNLIEEKINLKELTNYKIGELVKLKDGSIFGIENDNKIYVVENGKKRHIFDEQVFNAYGFKWTNIVWIDQLTGINIPTGQPLYLPSRMITKEINTLTKSDTTKINLTPEEESVYINNGFVTDINTYLVADYETEEILTGKNIDEIRPMASFTKVMTGYLLFKKGINIEGKNTFQADRHQSVYHNFRIVEGEQIYNKDLLNSMLVSSINTPAKMLVNYVEPDEKLFIKEMNKQAIDWGLNKTKFTDVSGYDLGNVTTAREYLKIFKNVSKNIDMKKYLGTKYYDYNEIKDLDNKPRHYDYNSNELMNKDGLPFNIITSKTGYLNEAGACLAMIIERKSDNKKFIIITMGNPDYKNRFAEPERLSLWTMEKL